MVVNRSSWWRAASPSGALLLSLLSGVIVAFGQAAWSPTLALLAGAGGYAIFWKILLPRPPKERFFLGAFWFFLVQLVQLSWFISHPYLYIWIVYLSLSALWGVQFGLLCLFLSPNLGGLTVVALPSFWVLCEWSRLFLLSGFSWNPVGMALAANIYSLQMASLAGLFGLSFWTFFTALLLLRAHLMHYRVSSLLLWSIAALTPYLFGVAQIAYHEPHLRDEARKGRFLLVQTAFPVEESCGSLSRQELLAYVTEEWGKILALLRPHLGKSVDLIVLPEFVVPFGCYTPLYPYAKAISQLNHAFGSVASAPSPTPPYGFTVEERSVVSNSFWAQTIANQFRTPLLAGLEDVGEEEGKYKYYSGALLFRPQVGGLLHWPPAERYEKRVLVPMGEYIPFHWCSELARSYGIFGSFTPGKEAKSFRCDAFSFSPSICYEETFGDLMREGRGLGAHLLVNMTSDVWYPHLTRHHLEHARLRSVEGGWPLVRSCNTGITAAIDSLGRTVALLEGEGGDDEVSAGVLCVELPIYNYATLYSYVGDRLIVGISLFFFSLYAIVAFRSHSFGKEGRNP